MSPGSKTPKLEGAIGVRPAAALIARAHPHGLPQIRLLKLLWLAELRYYERTGNRLTSAGWWRWDFGPYSKDVINTVKREGKWFRIEKPSDPTQRGLVIHAALGARPGGQNAEGATVRPAEAGMPTASTGASETAKPAVAPEASASDAGDEDVTTESSGGPDAVAQSGSPTASPSPAAEPSNFASNDEGSEGDSDATEHQGGTPDGGHRPYNIQIRAAMDLNGGNAMMKRLEQLGYQAHLVPTEIAGQTWYRIEVGPYTSQEEAAAAEVELRQKYNSTYSGGRPVKPQASANTGESPAQAPGSPQSTAQSSN